MTPEQVAAWLAERGGAARVEGPDANGVTTYHTAGGEYVTVGPDGRSRMIGYAPQDAGTQAASAAQPAPTPAAGGSGMNQQDVEQWIAANGGPGAVQYTRSSRRVRNPARNLTNADGSDNPSYDPTAPEWLDIAEEAWTNTRTGATLRVSRRPDGAFDVLDNKSADPNKPGAQSGPPGGKPYIDEPGPTGRRLGWNPETQQYDRDLGPAPDAQRPQTETVRRPVPNRPGYTEVTTKNPQTGTQETYYEDAQGNRVTGLPPDPTQNRPSVTIREDGQGGLVAISVDPQTGRPTTTPVPGVRGTPPTVNVGGRIYERQPDDSYVDKTPEQPGARTALPTGVRAPDFASGSSVTAEMARFLGELDAAIRAGTITREEAAALAKPYADLAQTALSEQTQGLTQGNQLRNDRLTRRSQDITDRNFRAQQAQNILDTAIAASNALVKGADPSNFKGTLVPLLALQMVVQDAMGASRQIDDVEIPAVARRAGATSPPAPPNAIGVPTTPPFVQPEPSGAEVAAQTAATTAATNAAIAPLLRPNPPVPAGAVPPAPAPSPAPGAGPPTAPAPAVPGVDPRSIGAPEPPVGLAGVGRLAQYRPMPTVPTVPTDNAAPPPPGAAFPLDPRPPAVYDREGINVTNSELIDQPPPHVPPRWPDLGLPPGAVASRMPPVRPGEPSGLAVADRVASLGPRTIQERAEQMIAAGEDPDLVRLAMGRFLRRHGIGAGLA